MDARPEEMLLFHSTFTLKVSSYAVEKGSEERGSATRAISVRLKWMGFLHTAVLHVWDRFESAAQAGLNWMAGGPLPSQTLRESQELSHYTQPERPTVKTPSST
ncbi:hypothetical protein Q8A67_019260 [Cirrhinus molitorella]|uniref:Uncharacterized protein n=1 Tax=Cirrhinus molitorella TaxID=172907 RepID=A0AA88TDI5_9TELE|nr:hypothetical protein Q8A67_019260 [Cirrhinus molitorella]